MERLTKIRKMLKPEQLVFRPRFEIRTSRMGSGVLTTLFVKKLCGK
jgi:hypothetical protein